MSNINSIFSSKMLLPTEKLFLIYVALKVACPSGRGPAYCRATRPQIAQACGISTGAARAMLLRFLDRGWLVRHMISDGGPYDGQQALVMPDRRTWG